MVEVTSTCVLDRDLMSAESARVLRLARFNNLLLGNEMVFHFSKQLSTVLSSALLVGIFWTSVYLLTVLGLIVCQGRLKVKKHMEFRDPLSTVSALSLIMPKT